MRDNIDLYLEHEAEQERIYQKWLKSRPICDCCGERITSDYYYDINGTIYCEDCLNEEFSTHNLELRSTVSDYSLIEGTEKQSNGRQVTMEFELIDVETGHSEKSTVVGEGFDKGDKAGYKAMTGALKYYLACTFLVATGDDPEKDSPDVKMNTRKISPAQKAVIEKKYTGERLQQLLDWAKVKSLDEMSDDQAFKVIMQIKEKEGMK